MSRGVRLRHDNARPHVSKQTKDLVVRSGWTAIPQPPYSPDLACSDYHLFPKLNDHLSRLKLKTDGEVKEKVTNFLNWLAVEFYEEGLQNWIVRLYKCI